MIARVQRVLAPRPRKDFDGNSGFLVGEYKSFTKIVLCTIAKTQSLPNKHAQPSVVGNGTNDGRNPVADEISPDRN